MLKEYSVTVNGSSNGNVIAQPFTISVHKIGYQSEEGFDGNMSVTSCTKNATGDMCDNDNVKPTEILALPSMASSNNANMSTFESLLNTVYGVGNWSDITV